MNISVIALDLDGTLLNARKEVSERNLAAVMNCSRNGKKIVIATARPPRSVRDMLPQELLDIAAFVYYNGAVVRDADAGIDEHYPIAADLATELLEYCTEMMPECAISVEANDLWFANREIVDRDFCHPRFRPEIVTPRELKRLEATKILLTSFTGAEPLVQRFGGRLHVVLTDQGKLLQAMNRTVSKSAGLLRLCGYYGVPASDLIAFGDDYNDMDMLRMAGYAVAMGNAVPELKAAAHSVTASNDEDGVAEMLERLL
ncbi:Cof-type HAD-IIB family hydrolase [Paenibacillus arenilitoris]|uniref:HAD family phosphatase n=1 Tax=Paenibacillus arenilitoris TaxID=2772299 RepID=A0A927H4S3_9BACL|nr:Cof-type HAD-IIB family hydrolase [Paenibacillus arenilitoris]MBD2867798.1 HAD family phosphatase [Paenibacillus arenilitoris]